jgi:hypothetical protein
MILHGYENHSRSRENGNRAAGTKYGTPVKPTKTGERRKS